MTNDSRNKYLQRTYGITLDEFNRMLEAQGYACAICGRNLRTWRIEVDHDHRVEKRVGVRASVRGLLCGGRYQGCNRRLGRIDNSDWLRHAAAYLDDQPARKALDNRAQVV